MQAAVQTDDKDDIEAKSATLAELSGKLAERVYQEAASSAEGAEAAADAGADAGVSAGADDVVDAEFEEVSDDNK